MLSFKRITGLLNNFFFKIYGVYKLNRTDVKIFGLFNIGNLRNLTLGSGCQINSGVYIQARRKVIIGSNVTLSMNVSIYDSGLDHKSIIAGLKNNSHIDREVLIEDNVWIGANAIILPGVKIGKNSVIGAGTVVTKNVPSQSICVGNPGRVVKVG